MQAGLVCPAINMGPTPIAAEIHEIAPFGTLIQKPEVSKEEIVCCGSASDGVERDYTGRHDKRIFNVCLPLTRRFAEGFFLELRSRNQLIAEQTSSLWKRLHWARGGERFDNAACFAVNGNLGTNLYSRQKVLVDESVEYKAALGAVGPFTSLSNNATSRK